MGRAPPLPPPPRFRGAGRTLRNGLVAVPVVSGVEVGGRGAVRRFDLELACGCSLRRHPAWTWKQPQVAGCPAGHGAELAAAMAGARAARVSAAAAVAAVLARWDDLRDQGASPGAAK